MKAVVWGKYKCDGHQVNLPLPHKLLGMDFRSDTVTQPTPQMLQAMMNARVGDDVFGEDPAVNELERTAAAMFGMEDALYCSSGTQANQIALSVHMRPGEEVICSDVSHIYLYEGGGIAQNAGASVRLIKGDRGRINTSDVLQNINADDPHYPRTAMVSVENTCNKGGGSIYDYNELAALHQLCRERKLILHCDGARICNAAIAAGNALSDFGKVFDSLSVCLSKGLGAPVGSVLLGTKDFIYRARRRRKTLGGGMRQAGFIAAAGLYALNHHIQRLKDDHNNAKRMGEALQRCEWVESIMPIETNIVIAQIRAPHTSAQAMMALAERGIKCFTFGADKIRWVTHLDIRDEHLVEVERILPDIQLTTTQNQNRLAGMY